MSVRTKSETDIICDKKAINLIHNKLGGFIMKKISVVFILLLSTSLCAYSACLIEKLEKNKTCTGAAVNINDIEENELYKKQQSDKEELQRMYQIPTMSLPSSLNNGFPILNPSVNCMFGVCTPR